MNIHQVPVGPLQTNCYIVEVDAKATVIDPGGEPAEITYHLDRLELKLDTILITHLHFDHIIGTAGLHEQTGAPVYASEKDRPVLESDIGLKGTMGFPPIRPFEFRDLSEGDHQFMGLSCKVLETPGHSPGSLSYYFPQLSSVFSGDLIFFRSVGRTDFLCGDEPTLRQSVLDKIFTLPDDTVIYPGHMQKTTVGDEKKHNPFFGSYNL